MYAGKIVFSYEIAYCTNILDSNLYITSNKDKNNEKRIRNAENLYLSIYECKWIADW